MQSLQNKHQESGPRCSMYFPTPTHLMNLTPINDFSRSFCSLFADVNFPFTALKCSLPHMCIWQLMFFSSMSTESVDKDRGCSFLNSVSWDQQLPVSRIFCLASQPAKTSLSWLTGISWSSSLVLAGQQAGFRGVLATSLAGQAGRPGTAS